MTDAQITGGVAFFEQSRKLADFENRKAAITFNVGEGQDAPAVVLKALGFAKSHVLAALFDAVAVQHAGPTEAPAAEPAAPTKNKGGRPAKPPATPPATAPAVDAADAPPPSAPAALPQIRTNPEDRKDPLDLTAFENVAPTITDEALGSALAKKNKALSEAKVVGGTDKIKALIAKTGATSYAAIPQSSRTVFLADLDAIK